jgi:hypothetical protein
VYKLILRPIEPPGVIDVFGNVAKHVDCGDLAVGAQISPTCWGSTGRILAPSFLIFPAMAGCTWEGLPLRRKSAETISIKVSKNHQTFGAWSDVLARYACQISGPLGIGSVTAIPHVLSF